jgi:hypothetical protein
MIRSRSLVLAVVAALAACTSGPSSFEPSGPPGVKLLAAPTVVPFGTDVQLSLTNTSSATILIVRPCPTALERWNGFSWDVVGDGSGSCSGIEDTLAPGAGHDFIKEMDVAKGLYRAGFSIYKLGTASLMTTFSNVFTVTQ